VSSNIAGGLAGLSLLTGNSTLLSGFYSGTGTISASASDSLAVRKAKANFTLPSTTPPWKQASSANVSDSARVAAIKQMKTIVDQTTSHDSSLPGDVKTSFVAYKALDSLRLLAEAASAKTLTDGQRASLNKTFLKGLADLQTYLGRAPSEKLNLAFGEVNRRADSVAIPTINSTGDVSGTGVVATRATPLAGVSGTERFTLSIDSYVGDGSVTVDLSTGPQPPTLDSIADAFNNAIAAVPQRNADGSVVLDSNGNPTPKWQVRFIPERKADGTWGFTVKSPRLEDVSIAQANAGNALTIATNGTDASGKPHVGLLRIDDPAGTGTLDNLASISAIDTDATARAVDAAKSVKPVKGVTLSSPSVNAAISAQASVTDAAGMTYIVGTTAGDMGANRLSGGSDLFLTKFDSQGKVVWQKMLGATGGAQGAAISLSPDGDIMVAGTVTGSFDGQNSDGDIMVARFDGQGDARWTNLVRSTGSDTATAITTAPDGTIYVGGQSAANGGDAFLARLDAGGALQERRSIGGVGSDSIAALATDGSGNPVALMKSGGAASVLRLSAGSLATDLGSVALGSADARTLAVADDGTIAVGGVTSAPLTGGQLNAISGGRDAFVTLIDSNLTATSTRYIGTAADDQIDSLSFMDGTLYAGGRTKGVLGGAKVGTTDGFVAALSPADGALTSMRQFGLAGQETGEVRIAAMPGGDNVIDALGLHSGPQLASASARLTANTSLRAGDEFSIRVAGGKAQKIVIAEDDTLATLSARLSKLTGKKINVTTAKTDGGTVLRIEAKTGVPVDLIAGAADKDALAKLGLSPRRLTVPAIAGAKDPKVLPGGSFGLGLSTSLALDSVDDAKAALGDIKSALSMTQTAYRSLYWDDGKAAIVNNGTAAGGKVSAYQSAQLSRYQDALTRISGILSTG